MTFGERIGAAIVRPRAALAVAGDRKHAGRSGSDLLLMIVVLLLATQLRALIGAVWLGVAVDATLGVRAVVATLTDTLVVDLGFLVVGALVIFAASGKRRELGRAFDLACVAALPLLFVAIAATFVVSAAELSVPRAAMWALSGIAYAWTGALIGIACFDARRPPAQIDDTSVPRRAGWAVLVVALCGIIVQIVWVTAHTDRVRPLTEGDPAPPLTLPRINGPDGHGSPYTYDLANERVIVVLDFWATWCNPCLKALPHLNALAERYPQVHFVTINIDDPEEAWKIFAAYRYLELLAGDQDTSNRFGVSAIPHTVLIDRNHRVVRVYRGNAASLERDLAALTPAFK